MQGQANCASNPDGIELSTTVFSGELEDWTRYLGQDWIERVDAPGPLVRIVPDGRGARFCFLAAEGDTDGFWARVLNRATDTVNKVVSAKPPVEKVCSEMLGPKSLSSQNSIEVYLRRNLPGPATRETRFDSSFQPICSRIVLDYGLVRSVEEQLKAEDASDDLDQLGLVWPILRRIFLQLAYPPYPRDRFRERIDITSRWVLLNLHVLYEGKEAGRLTPNRAGEKYEAFAAREEEIDVRELFQRHPFFRLLENLSFLLLERQIEGAFGTAQIVVRDYLDPKYLRLSISGLMPGIPDWLQPMDFAWKGKGRIQTEKPRLGRNGIIDHEDLIAWKKLRDPLADIGYFLLRQLGMGQFGRVYEAVNMANASIPQRVAIKVDRIRRGFKKEAIEAAESIMQTAAGLSASPHMIRVFDAGKLSRNRATYHVIQLVEGDTLDNLLGITGMEHASVLRPGAPSRSKEDITHHFFSSIGSSRSEIWRRARRSLPFVRKPGIVDMFDLLVSKMLWVEEVHRLGFAINDLKNGNVMISRRGQFKGIDLDAYSPIFSQLDKLGDFLFLSVASVQLLVSARAEEEATANLVTNRLELRRNLLQVFEEDLQHAPPSAPDAGELTSYFCGFVEASRSGRLSNDPQAFTEAINQLIQFKRKLGNLEMVLE